MNGQFDPAGLIFDWIGKHPHEQYPQPHDRMSMPVHNGVMGAY